MARSVPRNIDKPNRTPEYVVAFLTVYYGVLFLINKPFVAIGMGALATYLMYKVTMDKPEGLFLRMVYRYIQIGKMRPTPRRCKKLEV